MHFLKISLFLKFKSFLIVLKFSLRFNDVKDPNIDKIPVSQEEVSMSKVNISFQFIASICFLRRCYGFDGTVEELNRH